MGNTTSNANQTNQDLSSQLKLNIQSGKPVVNDLIPLLNWSLSQIRQIYAPFRRRKGSPILTRSQFLRFINLSKISSFHIYDCITKNTQINVFEIMAILTMGAYTNYVYKFQFLFNVFDFRCKKKLSFTQLVLMYKSIIRGYCFLTDQPLPQNQLLQKFGFAMFSKADLNNDQLLQIGQIVGWLESTPQNLIFFKIFEPTIYGKQDYHIFNSFIQYTNQQINTLHNRINKLYHQQKIQQQDYLLLKPIIKVRNNQNKLQTTMNRTWMHNKSQKQNRCPQILLQNNNTSIFLTQDKIQKFQKTQNVKLFPLINSASSSKFSLKNKKKFQNIIIIKGRTITKKQVFQLRQYFDGMSVGKKYILIQDFIQNFNQQKYTHMKSVAASLFNFLDKHQNGKIQFLDLVSKLYPNLSQKHIQIITMWSEQYNRNFNMDRKIKTNHNNDQYKKRVLPKTCITRLEQLYKFFDQGNKGYVDIKDLQIILGNACTNKQIKILFQSSDIDQDGKLTLKEFMRVLLPADLEIQGLG